MILGDKNRRDPAPWLTRQTGDEFSDLERDHTRLCIWLRTATDGLVAPAKERIRVEIEAHYTEAAAAHVTEGLSVADARAAAVKELGDAKAAARRFRKRHLTVLDAQYINNYLNGARSVGWLLVMYLLFFLNRDLPRQNYFLAPGISYGAEFLALVVVPTICFFIARHKGMKSNVRLMFLLNHCALTVWMATLAAWTGYWLLVICLIYLCLLLTRPLRLWYKLRSAGDDWALLITQTKV